MGTKIDDRGDQAAAGLHVSSSLGADAQSLLGRVRDLLAQTPAGQAVASQLDDSGLWSGDNRFVPDPASQNSPSDGWVDVGAQDTPSEHQALDALSKFLRDRPEGPALIRSLNQSGLWNVAGAGAGSSSSGPTPRDPSSAPLGRSLAAAPAAPAAPTAATAAVAAVAAAGGDASYGEADLRADLTAVLAHQATSSSGRALGNSANLAMWTDAKVHALYQGILAAHQSFYPELGLRDFAHLVLAEGAAESTGDMYRNDGSSKGFMQTTEATVVREYRAHGLPVHAPDGSTLLDPQGSIDCNDPGQSVALFGWYTRNGVGAGESTDEAAAHLDRGSVTRDFGNAQVTWLAGPKNDRHALRGGSDAASRYPGYTASIRDYFVAAHFGTQADYDRLLATQVGSGTVLLKS